MVEKASDRSLRQPRRSLVDSAGPHGDDPAAVDTTAVEPTEVEPTAVENVQRRVVDKSVDAAGVSGCARGSAATGNGQTSHIAAHQRGVSDFGQARTIHARLIAVLLRRCGDPPIEVELWSGERIATASETRWRVRIFDRATVYKLVVDPQFQFPEAYATGRLEVDGPLDTFLETTFRCMNEPRPATRVLSRFGGWLSKPFRTSIRRARANASHHYDIGNDFYKLWLDRQLLYTCAYFPSPDLSIEEAQIAKMDLVAKKLRLKPGERVIEAGCGWGALALHMASRYGVRVTAYNVSTEQIKYARGRARELNLDDRVDFVQDDWRRARDRYDAFVSVGMLEHVGPANYRAFGDLIRRTLADHGRGLIHTIGVAQPRPINRWIRQNIFPGASAPAVSQMMRIFEPQGFAVADVENLRPHYAETLRRWLRRFESYSETVRDRFDDHFVRMWRMYLASSIASFECGALQLYQVLFSYPGASCFPWSRGDLYVDELPANGSGSFAAIGDVPSGANDCVDPIPRRD